MNRCIRDSLFFLLVALLIFVNIPRFIQINFLGNLMGSQLVFYPILVGYIYTVYCIKVHNYVTDSFNVFRKYLYVCCLVTLASLIIGLLTYPYLHLIINSPMNQIDKLPVLLDFFNDMGVVLDKELVIRAWLFLRFTKNLILEMVYTLGGSYMIYCWYRNDWRVAIELILKATFVSLSVIFTYSFLELFYLCDNNIARDILVTITPYVHMIGENGFWWPPLLWPNQLRSVFAEPSYFGIYCAFALPLIWLMIIKTKLNEKWGYVYICTACVISFFLVLTKARTGFVLHIGELVVLFVLLIYANNKLLLKKSMIILLCSMLAFVCGNVFIANHMTENKNVATKLTSTISNYVDSNAISLANPDARSNRTRYSVMEADIKVGLEHPLFGIGSGLRNAYVIDAFTPKALENKEIQMWLDFSKRLGILKSGIPKLGEYTSRFAETGILGLLVFLFPVMYLAINMLRKLKRIPENEQITYIMYLTSLTGILASGIGDTINITYCYWVLLGLGYAMCFGRSDDKLDNE